MVVDEKLLQLPVGGGVGIADAAGLQGLDELVVVGGMGGMMTAGVEVAEEEI
jgi:hypothetical protein